MTNTTHGATIHYNGTEYLLTTKQQQTIDYVASRPDHTKVEVLAIFRCDEKVWALEVTLTPTFDSEVLSYTMLANGTLILR